MGRFRIQFLLEDNIWSTHYIIPKNSQYSITSTEWTLLNLDFTVENYAIKLIYDLIDTAHADMCFSNISITHSVYYTDNVDYFKDPFKSIPDYKKIVLLIFLIKNDINFLYECGFLKGDINFLYKEFKNILLELNGEYLDHIKNQEESKFEMFLNK